jgi:ketosteroid isomerase-like protein
MKGTSLICAMLVTLLFPALVMGQGETKSKVPQVPGVKQQLMQMEDDWLKAAQNKDVATLKRIIAEDWIGTNEKAEVVNREQDISNITANTDVIESDQSFNMHVRIYGNTAIVTGGDRAKGTRNGKAFTETYRWTDVFVKRGGTWQAVVSQWMKVP